MKLRNKRTGEIEEVAYGRLIVSFEDGAVTKVNSLAELNEEWEDYEEPKDRWYINENGGVLHYVPYDPEGEDLVYNKYQDEIGNYFETKEEAEKAVKDLKAWKRLKDKGFRFRWIDMQTGQIKYSFFLKEGQKFTRGDEDDLMLLFGGEE